MILNFSPKRQSPSSGDIKSQNYFGTFLGDYRCANYIYFFHFRTVFFQKFLKFVNVPN